MNSVFRFNVFVYFCFYEDLESTQLATLNIILFIEYLPIKEGYDVNAGFPRFTVKMGLSVRPIKLWNMETSSRLKL